MKLKSKISAGLILCSSLLGTTPLLAQEAPRTAFVQLFEWSWTDIATECETFLGPKGFAAVQVSPPQKSVDNPAWWSRYQPISYSFDSRSGNREQFRDMVQRCKAAGVDIYLDAVINHMAALDRNFPEVPYSVNDFHTCRGSIDYTNRWQVQNCDLVGLNDLKTESDYVRQKIADYMNDAISMGVAGFRIDAAKHIPAQDIAAIKSKLNGTPYIFQEVIGAYGEAVQTNEYTAVGNVTEFNFSHTLGPKFKNGGIKDLKGIGSWDGWLASSDAVTFVVNHDDERTSGQVLTYKDQGNLYMLGNVFMLAYPYGYPKIMSGYYFSDNDAGPPSTGVHSGNACGFDGGDWVCEHEWRGVANMVAFRNYTNGEWRVTDWWDDGNNQIAFGRGGLGFVVINRDDSKGIDHTFSTGMPEGEYCNVIAGDYDESDHTCSGETISVDSEGNAHFTVASQNAAAIHVGAKIGEPCSDCKVPVAATAICYDNPKSFVSPHIAYINAQPAGDIEDASYAMDKNGAFYCHDIGTTLTQVDVTFSDSATSQTDVQTTATGTCYQEGVWKSLAQCGFEIKPSPGKATKVCYDNAQNFSQPSVHYWNVKAATAVGNSTWPGVVMDKEGEFYCHDFGTNLISLQVILSDKGSNQTADLTAVSPNLCYKNNQWTDLANCTGGSGGETWYFRGTSNAWGLAPLQYDTTTGLYTTTQTFNGEESPARFKIDDGTWTKSYPVADYQVGDHATYRIGFNSGTKAITVSKQ